MPLSNLLKTEFLLQFIFSFPPQAPQCPCRRLCSAVPLLQSVRPQPLLCIRSLPWAWHMLHVTLGRIYQCSLYDQSECKPSKEEGSHPLMLIVLPWQALSPCCPSSSQAVAPYLGQIWSSAKLTVKVPLDIASNSGRLPMVLSFSFLLLRFLFFALTHGIC